MTIGVCLERFFEPRTLRVLVHGEQVSGQKTFEARAPRLGEDCRNLAGIFRPRASNDIDRDELLKSIWNAHGSRDGTFEISIENVRVRHQRDLIVATYEEWQTSSDTERRGRLSTAVFGHLNGELVWLHVHETWLPEGSPGRLGCL